MPPETLSTVLLLIVKVAAAMVSLTIALVTAGWAFARFIFEPRFARAIEKGVEEAIAPFAKRLENAEHELVNQGRDIDRIDGEHQQTEKSVETLVGELRAGLKEISGAMKEVASTQAAQGESIASIQGAMGQLTPLRPRRKRS